MSQIVIDTDTIKKAVLYFFAIVGVVAVIALLAAGAMNYFPVQQVQTPVAPAETPAATPAPGIAPAVQNFPYVVEFTVLSTTVANGRYQVRTTSGQVFNLPDYTSWNSLWPRNTYTATVTGAEPDGSLDIGAVNRLASPVAVYGSAGGSPVISFTVLSTTIINGNNEILTTDGRILYTTDYSTWGAMYPGDTYTATVIGVEANGALDIASATLVSTAYYYPRGVYLRYGYPAYLQDGYYYHGYTPPHDYPPHNPPHYNPPHNNPFNPPDSPLLVTVPDAFSPDSTPA